MTEYQPCQHRDCETRRELEYEGGDLEALSKRLCDSNKELCHEYILMQIGKELITSGGGG